MKILLPETLDEALEHLVEKPSSCLMAGGTALRVEWEKGCERPATLLSLSRPAGLDCVSISDEGVEIGALARLGGLLCRPQLRQKLPLLHAALNVTAGPAVRNLATIGGNVAGRMMMDAGCVSMARLAVGGGVAPPGADHRGRSADHGPPYLDHGLDGAAHAPF